MIVNDQVYISVKLSTRDGSTETVLTPSNVSDVKIAIASAGKVYVKQYSKNELTFDSTTNKWRFFVTEDMSSKFGDEYEIQAAYKLNASEWRHFDKQTRYVGGSIIPKGW